MALSYLFFKRSTATIHLLTAFMSGNTNISKLVKFCFLKWVNQSSTKDIFGWWFAPVNRSQYSSYSKWIFNIFCYYIVYPETITFSLIGLSITYWSSCYYVLLLAYNDISLTKSTQCQWYLSIRLSQNNNFYKYCNFKTTQADRPLA